MAKNTDHMSTIPHTDAITLLPSVIRRAMNFRVSSKRTTGIENFITVIHSSNVRGVTWKTVCKYIFKSNLS